MRPAFFLVAGHTPTRRTDNLKTPHHALAHAMLLPRCYGPGGKPYGVFTTDGLEIHPRVLFPCPNAWDVQGTGPSTN